MDWFWFLAGVGFGFFGAFVVIFGLLCFLAYKMQEEKSKQQKETHRFVANMAGRIIPDDEEWRKP